MIFKDILFGFFIKQFYTHRVLKNQKGVPGRASDTCSQRAYNYTQFPHE